MPHELRVDCSQSHGCASKGNNRQLLQTSGGRLGYCAPDVGYHASVYYRTRVEDHWLRFHRIILGCTASLSRTVSTEIPDTREYRVRRRKCSSVPALAPIPAGSYKHVSHKPNYIGTRWRPRSSKLPAEMGQCFQTPQNAVQGRRTTAAPTCHGGSLTRVLWLSSVRASR